MKHSLGKDRLEHSVFLRTEQVRNLWEGGVRRLWYCKSVQSNASASMPDVHDAKHTHRRDCMRKLLRCVVLIFQASHTSIVRSPRHDLAAADFSDFFAGPIVSWTIFDDTLSSIFISKISVFCAKTHPPLRLNGLIPRSSRNHTLASLRTPHRTRLLARVATYDVQSPQTQQR